jgi:TolB protein
MAFVRTFRRRKAPLSAWTAIAVSLAAAAFAHDASLERLTHDGLDKQRPMWSADGKYLTFARHEGGGTHIWQYVMEPRSDASLRRLTDRKTPEYNGAFSPDGTRILLGVINQTGTQGNVDIATVGVDGKDLRTIVGDVGGKLSHQDWPSWSPDGRRFAFTSTHEGNLEIYTANADGSDVVRVTQHPGLDNHPCWSPDGKGIAFATDRWGGLEIALVRVDGTGLVRLTRSPGLDDYPAISPDGSRIAFVTNRDAQYEVYVMRVDGSEPENLSRHALRDTYPTWTPDGRGVTFVSNRAGGCDIYTRPLAKGRP